MKIGGLQDGSFFRPLRKEGAEIFDGLCDFVSLQCSVDRWRSMSRMMTRLVQITNAKDGYASSAIELRQEPRSLVGNHVANMLHGVADSQLQPLKNKGKMSQHGAT